MRILVIEPDRIIRRTYVAALEKAGHTVAAAATAQEAVQAADKHAPKVVVLNIDMAKHNGVEFLYEFKSYPEWQAIPVVLLLSRAQHQLAENPVLREQLGVHAVLIKSQLSLDKLCEAVAATGQPSA